MLKSLVLAGGVALSATALAPAAEARTNVGVYFGVPFYSYEVQPSWSYYNGYGWYDADRYPDFHRRHHRARSDFSVYFGVPFYAYQVAPEWRYYDGYGWYDYGRYGDFRHRHNNLSCNAALRLLDRAGYDRVRVIECNGRAYTFRAIDRHGDRLTVRVNSRTGRIF